MASFWAITAVFLLIQALLTVGIQVTGKHPGDTKYGQPCSMPSSCTSSWYCCTAADKPGRCRLKHTLAITTMLCLWLMYVSSVCVRPMLLQEPDIDPGMCVQLGDSIHCPDAPAHTPSIDSLSRGFWTWQ